MKKVVITGGAYSGKTSLVDYFSSLYKTVEESALYVISDLKEQYGVEGQKKWREENEAEFQLMIAKKQTELENNLNPDNHDLVFLDRGIYDCLAFCGLRNAQIPEELLDIVVSHKYEHVFVLDTLSTFNERADTGRVSSKKESIKTGDLLEKVYKQYGMEVSRVREMPVELRASCIINGINSKNF